MHVCAVKDSRRVRARSPSKRDSSHVAQLIHGHVQSAHTHMDKNDKYAEECSQPGRVCACARLKLHFAAGCCIYICILSMKRNGWRVYSTECLLLYYTLVARAALCEKERSITPVGHENFILVNESISLENYSSSSQRLRIRIYTFLMRVQNRVPMRIPFMHIYPFSLQAFSFFFFLLIHRLSAQSGSNTTYFFLNSILNGEINLLYIIMKQLENSAIKTKLYI